MGKGAGVVKAEGKGYKTWFQNLGFLRGCLSMQRKAIKHKENTIDSDIAPPTPNINLQVSLSHRRSLHHFSFHDLFMATKGFRRESLVGKGGFGKVFKGYLIGNTWGERLIVAVKTLNLDGTQGHREWLAEVYILGNLHHPNVVKLIGYCIEADQRMLVYEYMPRGSLENHLFRGSKLLSWSTRMKVALDVAKGLTYLHEEAEKQIIYRDLKTSNILIDTDFTAKLSDFGLAKDGPVGEKTHISTRVMGTFGYAAPEYLRTGHLTVKSDVYSFGVVLLEIISGRKSIEEKGKHRERSIVNWALPYMRDEKRFIKLIDPKLRGKFSLKAAHSTVRLVDYCVSSNPKDRPNMSEVVKILEPLLDCDDAVALSPTHGHMFEESSGSNQNICRLSPRCKTQ